MAVSYYPRSVPSYNTFLDLPATSKGSGLRGLICQHGHNGNAAQIAQGMSFAGHPEFWADQGWAVIGVDMGGASFANPAAMTAITAAYNNLVSLGIAGTRVDLAGWSMGGGSVLRWAQENPTLAGAVVAFSPMLDMDWAYTQPAYTAEMDAAYGGSYATNGSTRGPAENTSAFTSVPILICHPTDDPTIPVSQSQAFVAAVNSPSVTMHAAITGGHGGGLMNVSPSETAAWLRANRVN